VERPSALYHHTGDPLKSARCGSTLARGWCRLTTAGAFGAPSVGASGIDIFGDQRGGA